MTSITKEAPSSGITTEHGLECQVATAATLLLREPNEKANIDSELLLGESFMVHELRRGWVRGRCKDGYEGWVAKGALKARQKPNGLIVTARAPVYDSPSDRGKLVLSLGMSAGIRISGVLGGFFKAEELGWIPAAHASNCFRRQGDLPFMMRQLIGTPYRWGGRNTAVGIDCSAAVQLAIRAVSGAIVPRDSGPQEQGIPGNAVIFPDAQHGDLAFWEGHVGVIAGFEHERTLIHATGHPFNAVVEEPLASVVERRGRPRSVKRPEL